MFEYISPNQGYVHAPLIRVQEMIFVGIYLIQKTSGLGAILPSVQHLIRPPISSIFAVRWPCGGFHAATASRALLCDAPGFRHHVG